jgi:Na+/melibiose symporter-like transporter
MSAFLVGLLMYGTIAILPLYAAEVLGDGSVNSGKLLIPLTAGLGIGVIVGGRTMKKISYKALEQTGWLLSCASLVILSLMSMLNVFDFWTYAVIFSIGTAWESFSRHSCSLLKMLLLQ